jgi:hypothetical protein
VKYFSRLLSSSILFGEQEYKNPISAVTTISLNVISVNLAAKLGTGQQVQRKQKIPSGLKREGIEQNEQGKIL